MLDNYFAGLQMQTAAEMNTVTETRLKMNEIAAHFKNRPEYEQELQYFSDFRSGILPKTLRDADAFFVPDTYTSAMLPSHLRHPSLGFCQGFRVIFSGRFVYPVKDPDGNIAGWCGYDAFEQIKYLDSLNHGYKAKTGPLYGMERIRDYYNSTDPVFVTEGVVCTLWLRQSGFQALALTGSFLPPYAAEILRRFGRQCVVIPDSDEAGNKLAANARRTLPSARVIQSTLAKDIDDTQKLYGSANLIIELQKLKSPFRNSEIFASR